MAHKHEKYGHIYLLERIGEKEVQLVFYVPVFNMRKEETNLHDLFNCSAIEDITHEEIASEYWQGQFKLGLSINAKNRVDRINKTELKDGKTEYFYLNWLEVLVCIFWMLWHCFKWYLFIFSILILTALFFIYK